MRGQTHLAVGCATWLAATAAVSSPHLGPLTLGTLAAGVGALLPDTDRGPLMRRLTGGHRHATHSLLGLAVATVLVLVADDLTYAPWWIVPAVAVGWLTHIVTDSMTVRGCPWLWPSNRRFWLLPQPMRITTGGKRTTWGPYRHVVRAPAYGEWLTANIVIIVAAACCYLRWR